MNRSGEYSILVGNDDVRKPAKEKMSSLWRKLGKPKDNKPVYVFHGETREDAIKRKGKK